MRIRRHVTGPDPARIYLKRFSIERTKADRLYHHHWVTTEGYEAEALTDNNLGHITSAISAMVKELYAQQSKQANERTTQMLTGKIWLDAYGITRIPIEPVTWKLSFAYGPHSITVNVDRDLENIVAAYGAAMKFFALKTGLITLESEVARNIDRAAEWGLLKNQGSA